MPSERCVKDPIQSPSPYAVPFMSSRCETGTRSITQCNLYGKGRDGFIIDEPGEYFLRENLIFKPKHANTQAITITVSNVILNLGIYSLIQDNKKTGVCAIAIGKDAQNVKVVGDNRNLPVLSCTGVVIYVLS